MSDSRTISESRKTQREATAMEFRGAIAAEQIADSLEGIRQDLTVLVSHMTQLLQAVSAIAHNTK